MAETMYRGDWASILTQLVEKNLGDTRAVLSDWVKKHQKISSLETHDTIVTENVNVIDKQIYFARAAFNPLILYAGKAVKANGSGIFPYGKDLHLTREVVFFEPFERKKRVSLRLVEIAEQDKDEELSERRVYLSKRDQIYDVSSDCFADDEIITWLARDRILAQEYGTMLRTHYGINSVKVFLPSPHLGNIARGIFLRGFPERMNAEGLKEDRVPGSFVCGFPGLHAGFRALQNTLQ